MRRALMWFNLYGCEAVWHKLENAFFVFLGHFEPHQCPLHQSILLIQGPIHAILTKKYWELAILENEVFLSRPFWISFFNTNIFFLLLFPRKHVKVYWLARMAQNFDQTKHDNTFWPGPNIMHGSVLTIEVWKGCNEIIVFSKQIIN